MSEQEDDPGAKLIPFAKPDTQCSLRVDRELPRARECGHYNVQIRLRPRRLLCLDCEEKIDPYEYILGLAEQWERLFPKNEAVRMLETALHSTLDAHGSITISDAGVTARRLTKQGAKLEAHETWGASAWRGGVAACIVRAVERLDFDAARWGSREVVYPRMTIEKIRGQNRWRVGVLTKGGWRLLTDHATSLNDAYRAAEAEAERMGEPFIHEDRPRKLWA